jgi:DNA-binding transcriptional ArsR family regulator
VKPTLRSSVCASKLAVLADPTRLEVLEILSAGPRNVKEINGRLRVAQNLLSHHLRVLREAGLVLSCRDGKAVRYELAKGVEMGLSGKVINLGCCSLTFNSIDLRKKVS